MTATYDNLLNPLNPAKADTLRRLYSVVGSMPVVLLGAFARDLLFFHIHGLEVPRATMDIDACVQMASWDDFNAACLKLKELGFRKRMTMLCWFNWMIFGFVSSRPVP